MFSGGVGRPSTGVTAWSCQWTLDGANKGGLLARPGMLRLEDANLP